MKKVLNMVIGGLQQKIFNLVLFTVVLIAGIYTAVILYQSDHLKRLSTLTNERQQASIWATSTEVMDAVVAATLEKNSEMEAYIADSLFRAVKNDVSVLGEYARLLFDNPSAHPDIAVAPPDPEMDGIIVSQLLSDAGTNFSDPHTARTLGLVGNLAGMMEAMLKNSDLNSFFVGTPEGILIIVDDRSSLKVGEDGRVMSFPVTERPWYAAAKEKGELVFTDIEIDAFSGDIGVVCALPVYADGELKAVVGADLFLDSMDKAVSESGDEKHGFACIVNQNGHVIFSPEEQGLFTVETSQEAKDLRACEDEELAAFVSDVLSGTTPVRLVTAGGREFYMSGAPMETVGWAVMEIIDAQALREPTILMQEQYEAISQEAVREYQDNIGRANRMIIILVIVAAALGGSAALTLAKRIVGPLNTMAKRMAALRTSSPQFFMEDAYRTGDEIEALAESFADLSAKTIRYVKEIRQVTAEKERIGTELGMARSIQASQIPHLFPAFPERKEFDIYASMTPAREVGGDFYDFFLVDDDHMALVMADVAGKGIPAALFMMIARILIRNRLQTGESPSRVLYHVNNQLLEGNEAEIFVTVWLAVLEISTGKGVAVNAGHEHPVLRHEGGEYSLVRYRHSPAVAAIPEMAYREHEFLLLPGDSVFVYTDGVPEATNKNDELFGPDRMVEALNVSPGDGPEAIIHRMKEHIDSFADGAEQFDDITMLCFAYHGPQKTEKALDSQEDRETVPLQEDKRREDAVAELTLDATIDNLPQVMAFVDEALEGAGCGMKAQMQLDVAVEEIFVNIASYAYPEGTGQASVRLAIDEEKKEVSITFADSGVPYDPLAKEDPDITLSAAEREIGGLGIFMVKKSVDDIRYEYRDSQNILTIRKKL